MIGSSGYVVGDRVAVKLRGEWRRGVISQVPYECPEPCMQVGCTAAFYCISLDRTRWYQLFRTTVWLHKTNPTDEVKRLDVLELLAEI